jgi:hypothetical protein
MSVCLSSHPPVRMSAWNNSAPTRRIFVKFDILVFFENLSRKFKFHYDLKRLNRYFTWSLVYIFFILSHSFLLRMRNVSNISCQENQTTHFMFNNSPPRKSCRLGDIVEKYRSVGQATGDNIKRSMRLAYWVPKATNTHTGCVIIIAFPLQ